MVKSKIVCGYICTYNIYVSMYAIIFNYKERNIKFKKIRMFVVILK